VRLAPVYRAPMRARDRDLSFGAGATYGVEHGLVGIGGALPSPPATIDEATRDATEVHGAKAGRMVYAFAQVVDGAFVWTRVSDGSYRLGSVAGPWRYDDSPEARDVGIHHVRDVTWLERRFVEKDVPAAIPDTFARGGRNFQRVHDEETEEWTARAWESAGEART
jgi:hypothetical protein